MTDPLGWLLLAAAAALVLQDIVRRLEGAERKPFAARFPRLVRAMQTLAPILAVSGVADAVRALA